MVKHESNCRYEEVRRVGRPCPVKELRRRAISSVGAANAYLPECSKDFNSRFSVEARSTADTHRPLAADEDCDRLRAWGERRRVLMRLSLSGLSDGGHG